MKYSIQTEIIIDAPAEAIWKVLVKTEEYPTWNPFVTKIEGNLKVGEKLEIVAGGMGFKPVVLEVSKSKELRWLGKLLFKGLFDGEHIFRIEELSLSKCRFVHAENFSGLLVGAFKKKLEKDTKDGFRAMNQALKERVESLNFVAP